jgi:hypothetical protein
MSLRLPALLVFAAVLPLAAAAEQRGTEVARTVHVPRDAAIAALSLHAGELRDLCAPGETLRRTARGWVCSGRRRAVEADPFLLASAAPERDPADGAAAAPSHPDLGRELPPHR